MLLVKDEIMRLVADAMQTVREFEVFVGNITTGVYAHRTVFAESVVCDETSRAVYDLADKVGRSNTIFAIYYAKENAENARMFEQHLIRRVEKGH